VNVDLRIVRGAPSAEELAAVVLALAEARAADVAAAAPTPARPAWRVAARHEALGARPAAAPADLRALDPL
jgi:hypothetical protein